jgi:hypothetical protein
VDPMHLNGDSWIVICRDRIPWKSSARSVPGASNLVVWCIHGPFFSAELRDRPERKEEDGSSCLSRGSMGEVVLDQKKYISCRVDATYLEV